MIKGKLDKKGYEALTEDMQKLYKADGSDYKLQVEGMTDKSKVDEFRNNNITLEESLKKFEGVDVEKYKAFEKTQKDLDDKKLIDAGDVEGLIKSRIEAVTSDFSGKLDVLAAENKKLKDGASAATNKVVIQDAAQDAFSRSRIKSDARSNILASINQMFEVDNGVAVARKDGHVLAGANGNLTISEFVGSQPDYMKEASTGGSGNGNEGGTPNGGAKTSLQKISSGLAALSK